MTRKEAFIALNMVPHLGPVRLRHLLDIFGSPDRVLNAGRNELEGVEGLNQSVIDSLVSWESVVDLEQELVRVQKCMAQSGQSLLICLVRIVARRTISIR